MYKNNNEISRYINIVIRKIYIFILVSLVVMSFATVYVYSIPKKYKADTIVFIEQSLIDRLVKGIAISSDIKDRLGLIKYSLVSRELISKTLRNMDIKSLSVNSEKMKDYILSLQKRTKIEGNNKNLFRFTIVDKNPEFAQKFINTLVSTYIEENVSANREDSTGANMFLDEQLQIYKQKVEKAEDSIIDFRSKQGVYFSTDEAVDLKEIKDYSRQIEDIELNINSLEASKGRLDEQLASLAPTVDVMSYADRKNSLAERGVRLKELQLRYTDDYPEVALLKAELATLKNQVIGENSDNGPQSKMMTSVNPLYQEMQQQAFKTDAEISSLSAQKQNLQRRIEQKESDLRNIPENKKELGGLAQERDSYQQIYQALLGRKAQSEVSSQMEIGDRASTFRTVDPAILPETPISPNMVRMILLAIMAGLGCGFGAVVLLDAFDLTIKDSGRLEAMGIEVLAIIPSIDVGPQKNGFKRIDYYVYAVSGVYCSGFFGLLFYEMLRN